MTPHQYFEAGKLSDAITAATAEVKKAPLDSNKRGILCELLCFDGAFERADQQLSTLGDLTANFIEILTSTGKYYWIALEQVETMEFRPPACLRDLLWRPTRLLARGTEGEVYLPTLYAGAHTEADLALRLGRATDWRG